MTDPVVMDLQLPHSCRFIDNIIGIESVKNILVIPFELELETERHMGLPAGKSHHCFWDCHVEIFQPHI